MYMNVYNLTFGLKSSVLGLVHIPEKEQEKKEQTKELVIYHTNY